MNRILAENCGQPLEKIERDVDRDYYMTADEAHKSGLIDKIFVKRA